MLLFIIACDKQQAAYESFIDLKGNFKLKNYELFHYKIPQHIALNIAHKLIKIFK